MPPTMLTHGKHRHCHLSIGLSSLAVVSHTTPNVGGTPLRVLALYIANRVHAHCLGKIGTANHAHIVDIMHTPRKTPPPNPLPKKGVKLKLPAFGNTLHLSNTRNAHRLDTAPRHSVHRSTHGGFVIHTCAPPDHLRSGYAVPRHLTATASSAGCYSRLQVARCRYRADLARLTA